MAEIGGGLNEAAAHPSGWSAATLADAVRRHADLHCLAMATFAAGSLVGHRAGIRPDVQIFLDFGKYLGFALVSCGLALATWRFAVLLSTDRSASPAKAILKDLRDFFCPARIGNIANTIVAVTVFASGFSMLKASIGILYPFNWDEWMIEADRVVHLGRLPHEYFWALIRNHTTITVVNFLYNLWFFVVLSGLLIAAFSKRDSLLRQQWLLSFFSLWLIAGVVVAFGFSSAGPCFVERLGLGDAYAPLMSALAEADRNGTIWALKTQDILWAGYIGEREGAAGISAFPSVHVATATLCAIAGWQFRRWLGIAMALFALSIQLGSVLLGWHYAIDGYAGAALAVLVWILVGRLQELRISARPETISAN